MARVRGGSAGNPGWWAAPAMALAGWLLLCLVVSACDGQVGRGPFTVTGVAVDEDGKPVPGLRVGWIPALPGSDIPDFDNLCFAVPDRDDHETETGADGRFTMEEVRDYFVVASHQYVIWGLDVSSEPARQPYWRLTGGQVNLTRTPPGLIEVELVARPAGALRLRVTGPDGRPFEGTLPLAFDRPDREGDDLVVTRRFVGGECLQGGLEPGRLRVRVLVGPVAEELKFKNYLTHLAAEGQPVIQVTPGDVREELTAVVEAGQTTELDVRLR